MRREEEQSCGATKNGEEKQTKKICGEEINLFQVWNGKIFPARNVIMLLCLKTDPLPDAFTFLQVNLTTKRDILH